jgi:hypothetical protein
MSFFRFFEKMPINRSYFTFPFLDKKSIPHQKDLLKHIKFRVESCKSLSHLNSFRFMLFSLCLGWYPANLCLLWNYRMDFSPIYIMFAAFSRDVQSVLVFCIQLSSDIVSDTFVVTFIDIYNVSANTAWLFSNLYLHWLSWLAQYSLIWVNCYIARWHIY